jgi:amidophosphoribosyltransferase
MFLSKREIEPGNALIIKKNGTISKEILPPTVKKVLSNAYFSRGSEYTKKENARKTYFAVLKSIDEDTDGVLLYS